MKIFLYVAGERRFFRVVANWLALNNPDALKPNLAAIPEYGRYDDLIYITYRTPLWAECVEIIKNQLTLDVQSSMKSNVTGVSLLAKWMPSINASSSKTKEIAGKLCKDLGLTQKVYRKTLSKLRERIKVLERLMSENRWDEIEFDKVPSKAGFIYRNAFARRDILKEKYKTFMKDTTTKVNANALFPYEVVQKAIAYLGGDYYRMHDDKPLNDVERLAINKYWESMDNVFDDSPLSGIVVCDTSGSMTSAYGTTIKPIDVAISLALYCADKAKGPFHGNYISFASKPQLIETVGADFVDKVYRIYQTNLCDNTNLEAVFELLLLIAIKNKCPAEDLPKTIIIVSDMEIDEAQDYYHRVEPATLMEHMRLRWKKHGYNLPNLVYWNVCARNDTFLDNGPNVTYVSGASKDLFKSVLMNKTGWELCLEILLSDRYAVIK